MADGNRGPGFAALSRQARSTNISRRFVRKIDTSYTAQAFITTDADNNRSPRFTRERCRTRT